jgi:hypothetical protein
VILEVEANFLATDSRNAKFSGVQHRRVAEGSPFFKMFKGSFQMA